MDRPSPLNEEWRQDLANLRSLNRHFGAYRIVRWFLGRRLRALQSCRILDLATGSADIPREIVAMARKAGVRVEIDAVDRHPATLEDAAALCAGIPEIRLREGDIREVAGGGAFDWMGGGYDFVLCSLALHHFAPDDAVEILRGMRRLAGRAALAADLVRSPAAVAGIYFITATVYRDPMTVADGRASALAAFSRAEFEGLARAAEWGDWHYRRFLYGRQAMVWENGTA